MASRSILARRHSDSVKLERGTLMIDESNDDTTVISRAGQGGSRERSGMNAWAYTCTGIMGMALLCNALEILHPIEIWGIRIFPPLTAILLTIFSIVDYIFVKKEKN